MKCVQVSLKNAIKIQLFVNSQKDAEGIREKILDANEKSFVNIGDTASILKSEVALIELFDCEDNTEVEVKSE